MDARQRLLDALAEVERLASELNGANNLDELVDPTDPVQTYLSRKLAESRRRRALGDKITALLPTLAALREVVEEHRMYRSSGRPLRASDVGVVHEYCRVCHVYWPCPTLRTLTRQFVEDF